MWLWKWIRIWKRKRRVRRENKNLWTLRECNIFGKGSSSHSHGGRKFLLDGTFSITGENIIIMFTSYGEQGWCSGESARLPPMCPGFDSRTRRHMWAEFVGSLLCSERFFSGNSGFPLSSKTNIWFDLIWFIWFTVSPISTALVLG